MGAAGTDDASCRPAPGAPLGPGEAVLDLTGLQRPQRHAVVIGALEALRGGTPLVIVNDHEPKGLQRQLERRYDARLGWEVRERVGERFTVAIRLNDPPPIDASPSAGATAGEPFPTAA